MESIKGKRAHHTNGYRVIVSTEVKAWLGPKAASIKANHKLKTVHERKVAGVARAIRHEVA